MKMVKQCGKWKITVDIPFLNPGPPAHLVVQSNEVPIIIDGHEAIVLTDLRAQVSSISSGFCEQMPLEIHPWIVC